MSSSDHKNLLPPGCLDRKSQGWNANASQLALRYDSHMAKAEPIREDPTEGVAVAVEKYLQEVLAGRSWGTQDSPGPVKARKIKSRKKIFKIIDNFH